MSQLLWQGLGFWTEDTGRFFLLQRRDADMSTLTCTVWHTEDFCWLSHKVFIYVLFHLLFLYLLRLYPQLTSRFGPVIKVGNTSTLLHSESTLQQNVLLLLCCPSGRLFVWAATFGRLLLSAPSAACVVGAKQLPVSSTAHHLKGSEYQQPWCAC